MKYTGISLVNQKRARLTLQTLVCDLQPFQFAMNDVYLRDTSRKVIQTLDTKRNNGKYVACPPYGDRKAERTTDQLVPDENTAPVVKMIFDLAAHFMGGEHQGQRRKPGLPPQHLRRHRLLRLLRRSYVFRRVRLQRRAGKILVSGVQQSDLPGLASAGGKPREGFDKLKSALEKNSKALLGLLTRASVTGSSRRTRSFS